MARKLVTIERIHNIRDIKGRDRVQIASILGWDVIILKNEFEEGELVCFAEIDSVFPKIEAWSNLERFKYRIKTFKVNTDDGPVYGQGYCFPLSKFHDIVPDSEKFEGRDVDGNIVGCYRGWEVVGTEITHLLRVEKYEPPIDYVDGTSLGSFPSNFISKTDEPRIQGNLGLLDEMYGLPYVIRLKYDGQSNTSFIHPFDGTDVVCSREQRKRGPVEGDNKMSVFWELYLKYNLREVYKTYPDYAMQYEGIGGKIQGNKMGINGYELGIFNIFNLKERRYLDFDEFEFMLDKFREISPNLKACMLIEQGESFQHTLKSLTDLALSLKYATGKPAEGIVIRPKKEMLTRKGARMSFKCINPEFLAKGGN